MDEIKLGQIVMVGNRDARILRKLKHLNEGKYITTYEVEMLDNEMIVILTRKDFNTIVKTYPKYRKDDTVKVVHGLYKGCEGIIEKVLDLKNGDFSYNIRFFPLYANIEDVLLEDWLNLKETAKVNEKKSYKIRDSNLSVNDYVTVDKEGKYKGMCGYVKSLLPGYTKNRYSVLMDDNTKLYFYESELKKIIDPLLDLTDFFKYLPYHLERTENKLTKDDYIRAATQAVDKGDKEMFEYYIKKGNDLC